MERTDNRSKDLEWRDTAAHSLPLEEGAWKIHVSTSLHPSDCLLMLSGTELKRNPAVPTDQCLWGHRAEWKRLETRSAGANRRRPVRGHTSVLRTEPDRIDTINRCPVNEEHND